MGIVTIIIILGTSRGEYKFGDEQARASVISRLILINEKESSEGLCNGTRGRIVVVQCGCEDHGW